MKHIHWIVNCIIVLSLPVMGAMSVPQCALADSYACKTECSTCKKVCEKTLKHCTELGGEHAQAEHIKILNDCITACSDAEMAMGKKDTDEKFKCNMCMEACKKCADYCDTMKDDKVMRDCAKECKMCIKALKARWGYNDAIQPTSHH